MSAAELCRTNLDRGVRTSDGDGTVPLLSLGTLCRQQWRTHRSLPTPLNPAKISVVTREYRHEPLMTADSAGFNYMNLRHQYEKLRRFKRYRSLTYDICLGAQNPCKVSIQFHRQEHHNGKHAMCSLSGLGLCRVYPRACDHLDVLSHEGVLQDLLQIAAGKGATLQDQIVSDIDAIARNMSSSNTASEAYAQIAT